MFRTGYGNMLAAGIGFGVMALFVGLAHRMQPELSTALISFIRALVNLGVLVALSWREPSALLGDKRPALFTRGVAGAVALLAYFGALARIGLGEAAFLNQTSAFWVALLMPLFLKEKFSNTAWVALVGAMGGMGLLSVPRTWLESPEVLLPGTSSDNLTAALSMLLHPATFGAEGLGRLLGAASGFLAALAYVSVRTASATNTPNTIVFYFTGISVLACLPILATEPMVWPADAAVWACLILTGLAATFAQLVMTRAWQLGPTSTIVVVGYSGPLSSALLGLLFLDQTTDVWGLMGMGLILVCGIALPLMASGAQPARPGPATEA